MRWEEAECVAGMVKMEFQATKGVCFFSPKRFRVGRKSRMVIRATQKVRCKHIIDTPGRISSSSIIRPLGSIVHVTARRSRGAMRGGHRGRGRTFGVYRRGVHGRKLSVGLVRTRCAFSGGGILFCFATSKHVSFHRLMGSLTTIFEAEVRLHRVKIESRAGVHKKVNVYKHPLYYDACLARFTTMSVGVTGRRGLSLGPAGVSKIYKELVYYLAGRRRACRILGDRLPSIKSGIAADSKLAKAMRSLDMLHELIGIVIGLRGSRGRVHRCGTSSLGFHPEEGGRGMSGRRRGGLTTLRQVRGGRKTSGLSSGWSRAEQTSK